MKILIASDHGGFELKNALVHRLQDAGHDVEDLGPQELNPDDDYPQYAFPLAERVAFTDSLGVLICRSGNGMAIAANKVKGVRAALCFTIKHAEKARQDDHANVLVLDADYEAGDTPEQIVGAFLESNPDPAERHNRRVQQITDYESSRS